MTFNQFVFAVLTSLITALFLLFGFAQTSHAACVDDIILQSYDQTTYFETNIQANTFEQTFDITADTEICAISLYGRRLSTASSYSLEVASDVLSNSSRTVYATTTFLSTVFSLSNAWSSKIDIPNVTIPAGVTAHINISLLSGTGRVYLRGDNISPYYLWYSAGSAQTSTGINHKIHGILIPELATSTPYVILSSMPSTVTCLTTGATTTCTAIQDDVLATSDIGVVLGIAYVLGFLITVFLVYVFAFGKR